MGAKHWTGLIALVLFVNIQVQGLWFNEEPAAVAAAADDDVIVQRDGVTCLSPDDCQSDEYCLSNVRPIVKRSARTKRWFSDEAAPSEGVCQTLGTDGSACIIPFSGIFPDPKKEVIALDMSPCAAEYTCVVGSDVPTNVAQGEVGSCELKKSETEKADELLQLLGDKEEEKEEAADNSDEELTDNDARSESDNADNDDNNDESNDENNDNYNADEAEPVEEEKEEEKEQEEETAEEWEEEKPLENTIDDFPAESEYGN